MATEASGSYLKARGKLFFQGNGSLSGIMKKYAQKDFTIQSVKMPRLTKTQRSEAIGMMRAEITQQTCEQHFNCSRRTIIRLHRRYMATGSVDDSPRSGRPKVLTPRQDGHIRTTHKENPFRATSDKARQTHAIHV